MRITRSQLRKLITEALTDIKYATRSDDGYSFASQLPADAEEVYGQEITAGAGDVKTIRDFFFFLLVDVNIIVIPDRAFKGIVNSIIDYFNYDMLDLFTTVLDNNVFSKMLYTISAKGRGLSKELSQVREQLDPNSYNIIIQRKDQSEASGFMFDLSWISHDLFGHSLNFGEMDPLTHLIDSFSDLFSLGKLSFNKWAIGGEFEKKLKVQDRSAVGESQVDADIQKGLQADFKRENFTSGVGHFDLGASVVGYYVINGRFPPTILDAIADGTIDNAAIAELENALITKLEQFKGKAGFVNFGDIQS